MTSLLSRPTIYIQCCRRRHIVGIAQRKRDTITRVLRWLLTAALGPETYDVDQLVILTSRNDNAFSPHNMAL